MMLIVAFHYSLFYSDNTFWVIKVERTSSYNKKTRLANLLIGFSYCKTKLYPFVRAFGGDEAYSTLGTYC